ncbi:MAG: DUF4214 domain-containing protein [Desulfobacterales bacterium]|nr:MAG: DUF4214 domain-containing protein [Desulfobacterales bacterium]
MKVLVTLVCGFLWAVMGAGLAAAGPYAPAAEQPGSTAVSMDDPALAAWATAWQNYLMGTEVSSTFQTPEMALGPAEGTSFDIVSLGRGGAITLTFDQPIRDGAGWDLAVFENSFSDDFLELAYVEVSSDGVTFVRFDNNSLTSIAVGRYGSVDPTNIDGLAGKYRQGYGTPFDLADLAAKSEVLAGMVKLNCITHVRIVDVVGDGTAFDTCGDVIWEPYPTVNSAGFDLDAAGVRYANTADCEDSEVPPLPFEQTAEDLIAKYYQDILDREPDALGAAGWKSEIQRMVSLDIDIKEGFVALARFFFNSDEYSIQDKTDAEYVTDLYQTFFNRAPDSTGSEYWIGQLDQGVSRNVILNFFVYSEEFSLFMAERFGEATSLPQNNLVNDFYRGLQGRLPDTEGFNCWVRSMRAALPRGDQVVRELSYQIAAGFLLSQEYTLRNKSDREFLEDLYNGILRRGASKPEFDGWLDFMEAGMTREEVLRAFADSQEFQLRVQTVIDSI